VRASITRAVELDAGHRVATHDGKCRSPHGHRYRVEATVEGDVPSSGMVLDFGFLAQLLRERVHDWLDHTFVVASDDEVMREALATDPSWRVVVLPYPPTAEHLAHVIGTDLADSLPPGVRLAQLAVMETPNSLAVWTP
jgi:6-pyruvoyltetrahydropterin/6-carboxytetrahydropterin synthase